MRINGFKVPDDVKEFNIIDSAGKVRYYKRVLQQYEFEETHWIEVFPKQKQIERGAGDDYPIIDLKK